MAELKIKVDEKTKKQASALFEDLGLDIDTAVNIFLKKAIQREGIPFTVGEDVLNARAKKALKESEEIARQIEAGTYTGKRYTSAAELFADLKAGKAEKISKE